MKPIYQIDITKEGVYFADVLDNGAAPLLADMEYIGEVVPESMSVAKDDDTITDLKVQETKKVALSVLSEIGATNLIFETRNVNPDMLILAFGGAVTAEGVWSEPVNAFQGREKAIAFVSNAVEGLHTITYFPRMKMTAKKTGAVSETETNNIQFTCKKLQPTNETVSPNVKVTAKIVENKPAASDLGLVDDANNSFEFDYVENFDSATDYEYSTDSGVIFTDVTVNPITGLTGAIAVGALHVRVKAVTTGDNRNTAGFPLKNTEPFTV